VTLESVEGTLDPSRPLKVAVLVKQVPLAEELELDTGGRLRREGLQLELNPYCRRAVAKGAELAKASNGTCTVITLGPPSADEALREAIAWGVDRGVHLCDPLFAGSDTLATAQTLAAALRREGPFDVIFVGRNTTDGDTGQVGPEVAGILDLPFCAAVRRLTLEGESVRLLLEDDDGFREVEARLPIVLGVAERLCSPCKMEPDARRAVPAERIQKVTASELGAGPWGDAASPTRVGAVRQLAQARAGELLSGDVASQVVDAARILAERGALTNVQAIRAACVPEAAADRLTGAPVIAVVVEEERPVVARELLGSAAGLAAKIHGRVVCWLCPNALWSGTPARGFAEDATLLPSDLGPLGADEVVEVLCGGAGALGPGDVADELAAWASEIVPWAILAPSTSYGREIAARVAVALGAGLVGDAIDFEVSERRLVAQKPGFSGAVVAEITCSSEVQIATVRPGVLPILAPRDHEAPSSRRAIAASGRVRAISVRRDDDVELLARSEVVVGVGTGVDPTEYQELRALAGHLGGELAATRRVTDAGWMPRSRQVGVTGRSIAPRLYIAVGLSGSFNHMVGVRGAHTILAVNTNPDAPVFAQSDIGIVGDWHEALPLLRAHWDQHRSQEFASVE
jgi:electron transfer flavoprotein alpha subunit